MDPGERSLLVQLRRGVVENCVLALLWSRPRYGIDLVRQLAGAGRLVTSEGTIYPLLSRLRRDGLVETSWSESPAGPPRRYYTLTEPGKTALKGFVTDWQDFRDSVDQLLGDALEGHR